MFNQVNPAVYGSHGRHDGRIDLISANRFSDLPVNIGSVYLNSGTWADLIRFPTAIFAQAKEEERIEALRGFVDDLASGAIGDHIYCRPTYIRLDIEGDRVVDADVIQFEPSGQI